MKVEIYIDELNDEIYKKFIELVYFIRKENMDMTISIEAMNFTVRTANSLKAEGIETLGELSLWSKTQLLKTPNIGKKNLNEIKEIAENHGVILKP